MCIKIILVLVVALREVDLKVSQGVSNANNCYQKVYILKSFSLEKEIRTKHLCLTLTRKTTM